MSQGYGQGQGQGYGGGQGQQGPRDATQQIVAALTPIIRDLVHNEIETRWGQFVTEVNTQLESVYETVNETQTTAAALQRFVLENQVETARTREFAERYTEFLLGEALAMGADARMVAKMAAQMRRAGEEGEEVEVTGEEVEEEVEDQDTEDDNE